MYCVLFTVCILYTVYRILYTVYCELYTVYCILYTVYCILYQCILYTVNCILWTVNCELCTFLFNFYYLQKPNLGSIGALVRFRFSALRALNITFTDIGDLRLTLIWTVNLQVKEIQLCEVKIPLYQYTWTWCKPGWRREWRGWCCWSSGWSTFS